MPSNSQLIFDSYFALTSACPSYQQCWMCDETIFRILNAHYPSLKKTLTFNRKGLNRALSAKASPCTSQNLHGIYMATFSTACPYSGDFRKVSYYFRRPTNDNQPPDHPVSALDVFDKHATSNQLQRNCIRLGNNMPNLPVGLGGLLSHYTIKPPSYTTVLRWVHYLGFKQDKMKKSYYVDGHEHEDQKRHRSEFTNKYLTQLEARSHRWVQMSTDQAEIIKLSLPANDPLLSTGYIYSDPDTATHHVEFHVDDHDCLQDLANTKYGALGGNVSVRKAVDQKPLIIFGQDESIFNQFSFGSSQWVGPSGERSILPKSAGMGVMVSAFQSREFGWGLEIDDDQLDLINARRDGNDYFDAAAAAEVNGTSKKAPLTNSPFVKLFEFGGRNGYWTGNHMILQTEDCIDCLQVIFESRYDFVFLFDHSSGHAKKRAGGLSVTSMTKGFGGEMLRNTKIEMHDGYLGPYHDTTNHKMVQVGDEQVLIFSMDTDDEDGPFYLPPEKRRATRYSTKVLLPPEKAGEKNRTKNELIDHIMSTPHGEAEGRNTLSKMLLRDLQKTASQLGLPTKKHVTHRVISGWEGRGKGMLQILWERGWIDVNKLNEYKMMVEDDAGFVVPEYSLSVMMGRCTDFANEKSQLEYVCESLGVEALITTKYHAEYAGEGIEYSWGASKAVYRRYPLASKKGKENFDKLVSKCISRELLTNDRIRKFSRRARSYMLTYKSLDYIHEDGGEESKMTSNTITHTKIESMKKILKSHRAALDFDRAFVVTSIKTLDVAFDWQKELGDCETMTNKKRKRIK